VCFGLLAYAFFGRWDPAAVALYLLLVFLSMSIYVAFNVLAGSLGFWLGNAEAASFQVQQALINFSLYPGAMFQGWIRVVLFTVVPAGFISHVPVELLHSFDPWRMAALGGFALLSVALAVAAFRTGLRRYESGNLVGLRG
jgi:ABC-2 type transport system permease protein